MNRPCLILLIAMAYPVLAGQPPAPDTPAIVPFDQLSTGQQRVFERQAENYIKVGQAIWSIEVWLRIQRSPALSAKALEPYGATDAPIFYDPVADRRVQSLTDLHPSAKDYAIVYGKVADRSDHGALIITRQGAVYVYDLPDPTPTDSTKRTLLIVKPDGQVKVHAGKDTVALPAFRIADACPMQTITPAQLAEWAQQRQVERFEKWRFRKVWDRDPKAKTVYVGADKKAAPTDTGGTVAAGSSEPVEIVTDAGQYHYEWQRAGPHVSASRPPSQ